MPIDRDNLIAFIEAVFILLIIGVAMFFIAECHYPPQSFYQITCPCPDGTSEINISESDTGSIRRYTADCNVGDGIAMVECSSELLESK